MEPQLALPRQKTTVPILFLAIVSGLLLSPLLERAIDRWLPHPPAAAETQHQQPGGSTWDLRTMWN